MIELELKLSLFNKVVPISDKEESSRNIEVKGNVQHDAQDTSNLLIMFDTGLVKKTPYQDDHAAEEVPIL